MKEVIRIGTRDSELALWQATTVQNKLESLGYSTTLIPVKSQGDLVLDKPLYELGITGIFTKTLDIALIKGDIDIAVHSMKDVPTLLPEGVVQAAVMERAVSHDILVHKGLDFLESGKGIVATGSLRRKAQWLNRYPKHKIVNLRGNVNTRLIKLIEKNWNAAIFAQAGLERIKLLPKDALVLDWMVPAPAQGAMVIVAMEKASNILEACANLNHEESALATRIEREFLRTLEGGCTAPIGALAEIKDHKVYFRGCLHSLDGEQSYSIEKQVSVKQADTFGKNCALEILESGGQALMESIKDEHNSIH
ncbi:MAG: hydroxymethylbilane synthase [Croceitalea sp.]|nr:hydroxymethylbilane synthase [Croceitalea sp.]MBT8239313.1 hydroxymethylbilane synthase [Croceitalea sp.]NNC34006.1 hydroxymethylbilane synthase [Croceitalea sp.]NNM18449.1 hydroxymethylbilane synthase [Croceitalea sp.]